jgi:hypothetical protein
MVLQSLIYAILPGGDTIFHRLAREKPQALIKLFEYCHPDHEIKLHIPFLQNFEGDTMISICIMNQDFKTIDTVL